MCTLSFPGIGPRQLLARAYWHPAIRACHRYMGFTKFFVRQSKRKHARARARATDALRARRRSGGNTLIFSRSQERPPDPARAAPWFSNFGLARTSTMARKPRKQGGHVTSAQQKARALGFFRDLSMYPCRTFEQKVSSERRHARLSLPQSITHCSGPLIVACCGYQCSVVFTRRATPYHPRSRPPMDRFQHGRRCPSPKSGST